MQPTQDEVILGALLCVFVLPFVAIIVIEFSKLCGHICSFILSGISQLWMESGRKRDYEVVKRENEISAARKHDKP